MIHLDVLDLDESKLGDICRRYQVRELSVFGSAARGEMKTDSDVVGRRVAEVVIRSPAYEE